MWEQLADGRIVGHTLIETDNIAGVQDPVTITGTSIEDGMFVIDTDGGRLRCALECLGVISGEADELVLSSPVLGVKWSIRKPEATVQ